MAEPAPTKKKLEDADLHSGFDDEQWEIADLERPAPYRLLVGMILLCMAVRLFAAWQGMDRPRTAFFRPDSELYYGIATSLMEDGRYAVSRGSEQMATARPPGYPVFLASLLGFCNGGLICAILGGMLFSSLTVVPIFLSGELIGGRRAGWFAAFLWCLNITSIAAAPMVLSDTLYTFFVAWQVYMFLVFWRDSSVAALKWSVVINAFGTLIRPAGLFWILPLVFLILCMTSWTVRRRVLVAVLSVILSFAVWTPWMARNARLGAGFRLETTIGTFVYYYNAAAVMASVTGESSTDIAERWMAEDEKYFEENPELFPDEASRVDYQVHKGMEVFLAHPSIWLMRYANPMILLPDIPTFLEIQGVTQSGRGTLGVLNSEGLKAAVEHYFGGRTIWLWIMSPFLLVVGLTYLFCLVELGHWVWMRRWGDILVFAGLALYFLVLSSPAPAPRYQLPALPMMLSMAGAAMARWTLWRRA
jgi:4-amino-4-deoxy-L-arabinose transferase-like glycosyltransferase